MSKVVCEIKGCKASAHAIPVHLTEVHQAWAPKSAKAGDSLVDKYIREFPNADLFSPEGLDQIAESKPDALGLRNRTKSAKDMSKGFGFPVKCTVFDTPTAWTPDIDPTYVFPVKQTRQLLYAWEKDTRNNVWIGGVSGSGKSKLIEQVCAYTNREFARVNFDYGIGRADLVGEWVVKDGATYFQYGIVPLAMMKGAALGCDELDCANPYALNVLRSVLEHPAKMTVLEVGGKVINAHEDFRVAAACNSFGGGDDSGDYGTVQTLSAADVERFSYYLKLNYMEAEREIKVLKTAFPGLDTEDAERFVEAAGLFRQEFTARKLSRAISTRVLLSWVETAVDFAEAGSVNAPFKAAEICFLNQMPADSRIAGEEALARIFQLEDDAEADNA